MELINLTPHAINIVQFDGGVVLLPASGQVARVATSRASGQTLIWGDSVSIQTSRVEFGEVDGLPDPVDNTVYIVSGMVASRVNRSDVFAPGELVRDAAGAVIGCKGLTCSG